MIALAVAYASPSWAKPTKADIAKAKKLSAEGDVHFDDGNYTAAATAYTEAYELSDKPGFLYNIGQAHRLDGKCKLALEFYQRYKDSNPPAERVQEVDLRIVQMEKCVEQMGQTTHTATPVPIPVVVVKRERAPIVFAKSKSHENLRLPAYIAGGVGVAALIAGTFFAIDAERLDGQIDDELAAGGEWDPDLRAKNKRGARSEKLGIAFLATGGAALAGAAVLYVLSRPPASEGVAVTPTAHGASIAWTSHF